MRKLRGVRGLAAAALVGFVLGAGSVLLVVWRAPTRELAQATVASPPPPLVAPAAPPPCADLAQRDLLLPVQGAAPTALADSFDEVRGERTHEALDIMAPRGTPVMAVDDGTIAKLFESKHGGLTIYQFDLTSTYAYYYAHLQRYAPDLVEGNPVHRGQVVGYVGTTGNAHPDSPHLHFAIFRLGPEKRWWTGTPVNPFPLFQ